MDTIQQAESLVRRLPDVVACRIEADAAGRVHAVHVTTRTTPYPSLPDDVATLLGTDTGLQVRPDQVHVTAASGTASEARPHAGGGADAEAAAGRTSTEVPEGGGRAERFEDAGGAAGGESLEILEIEGRAVVVAMRSIVTLESSRAEIELALGDQTAHGFAESRGAAPAFDLMAQACLDALEKLCGARVALRLVAMQRTTTGPLEVVTVVVSESEGRNERRHVGAAAVDGDVARAAAYAALDSMNRRLGRILAQPPRTYRIG